MTNEKKDDNIDVYYALTLVTQIGLVVSITIVVFMAIGYLVDSYFKTSPAFVLVFLFLSSIASMYQVYRLVSPLLDSAKKKKGE